MELITTEIIINGLSVKFHFFAFLPSCFQFLKKNSSDWKNSLEVVLHAKNRAILFSIIHLYTGWKRRFITLYLFNHVFFLCAPVVQLLNPWLVCNALLKEWVCVCARTFYRGSSALSGAVSLDSSDRMVYILTRRHTHQVMSTFLPNTLARVGVRRWMNKTGTLTHIHCERIKKRSKL